jgi:hypothetical protein
VEEIMTKLSFKKKCSVTGRTYMVTVDPHKYHLYRDGKLLIQDALPDLTPDEREFLISGLTPAEFNVLVGSDETD